jgi:putative spermidine/putrescine transport system permease protein
LSAARLGELALWGVAAFCIVFLISPSLIVIPVSFSSAEILSFPPPGFSLRWYREFFTHKEWLSAVRNSFVIAGLTTLTATVLGTMAALGMVRGRFPLRGFVSAVFLTPMVVPVIITAVAAYRLYARFQLIGTIPGMVLAHTVLALPFVIINAAAVLQAMDWHVEQAARSLGAAPLQTFCLVVLPMILPGVLVGALFAFITSFDELIVALFISGIDAVTLPVRMWSGIRFEYNPTVAAVSTMLIALSIGAFAASRLLSRVPRT